MRVRLRVRVRVRRRTKARVRMWVRGTVRGRGNAHSESILGGLRVCSGEGDTDVKVTLM